MMRRQLAAGLIEQHLDKIMGAVPQLNQLWQRLAAAQTTEAIAEIDLDVTEAFVEATGMPAYRLVFNSIRRMVYHVPHLLLAMYGDAAATVANNRQMAARIAAGAPAQ